MPLFNPVDTSTLVTLAPTTSTRNTVQPTGDFKPLVVKGSASQTATLTEWQDSGANPKCWVASNGTFNADSAFLVGTGTQLGTGTVRTKAAATVALVVWAWTSQSADLQTWLDQNQAVLFSINAAGMPGWVAAANQQTTVGAAGAASALPATPTKYLKVKDSGGTTLVVPAYAAS